MILVVVLVLAVLTVSVMAAIIRSGQLSEQEREEHYMRTGEWPDW